MSSPDPYEPESVAALLESAVATIRAEVEALAKPVHVWHPEPGEWSINEIIGHLIEAERRGFAGRIKITLASKGSPARGMGSERGGQRPPRRHEAGRQARGRARAHARGEKLVRVFSAADLKRGGEHPKVGWLRVSDLLQEWVHHDRNHIKQMLSNVQAWAWPHMGNSQKFSGE